MHHPYLVYILFGMPSLHLFTFLMFFIFLLNNDWDVSHYQIRLQNLPLSSNTYTCSIELGHAKLFSCFWSYKMTRHQAFFFLETKVERKQQMHHRGLGLGTRLQNADTCVSRAPKDRGLDDEATECRLCKHCGCMLNTDYIWLCKSIGSEKVDPHKSSLCCNTQGSYVQLH